MSYWQRDLPPRRRRSSLPSRVDAAVIGGGLAGLMTAIRLRERGANVVVLEAEHVGFGASGRNAGFLTPLPAPVWLLGSRHAWAALHLNREVHAIARWLGTLDCELAPATLAMRGTNRLWESSVRELAEAVSRAGLEHRLLDSAVDPHRVVLSMDAYTLHPQKLVHALADHAERLGVQIVEGTRVRAIEGTRLRLATATVDARTIVVCTNGYTGSLDVGERVRALTVHSFLAASAPLELLPRRDGELTIEVAGLYQPYHRLHAQRLIFGGVDTMREPRLDGVRQQLAEAMSSSVPGARIADVWGGAFHATTTGLPIIRRSSKHPAIVLNVGYGGTGVALALTCARLVAGLVLGTREDEGLLEAIDRTRISVRAALSTAGRIATRLARPWRC